VRWIREGRDLDGPRRLVTQYCISRLLVVDESPRCSLLVCGCGHLALLCGIARFRSRSVVDQTEVLFKLGYPATRLYPPLTQSTMRLPYSDKVLLRQPRKPLLVHDEMSQRWRWESAS